MSILRACARPMLASVFLHSGADALLNPRPLEPLAEPVVDTLADHVPAAPQQTDTAIRVNAAVQVAAGALLATGRLPRPAALALAATLVPVTWAGHRFWEEKDEARRAEQRIHFLKNLSLFGGLLIAAADSGAEPSLAWRARHRLHRG
ncbi:DoxX family protein [Kitasatospora sp. NBC_00240]|uniref:DoxX family membrane protein n=1 Tax=Kitasatospora sp. NBC_00240 TaxID=2903567 RepID=UPI00224D5958|nr:DoxX family protein [Kitasatospora sp. NBC_00240]MCX5208521.1 DoxX family protein [Kitasatospora sp. NBC_00240]